MSKICTEHLVHSGIPPTLIKYNHCNVMLVQTHFYYKFMIYALQVTVTNLLSIST